MRAIDDILVHLRATLNVIRLDRQHLLQRIGRAVCFECPDFHLTESLATKLCLTTKRLLRNQTVRSGRTCMHLVVDEVVQLQHVHIANGGNTFELLTGAPIDQLSLTGSGQPGQFEQILDLLFGRTVEDGRRRRHTVTQITRQLGDLIVRKTLEIFGLAA